MTLAGDNRYQEACRRLKLDPFPTCPRCKQRYDGEKIMGVCPPCDQEMWDQYNHDRDMREP